MTVEFLIILFSPKICLQKTCEDLILVYVNSKLYGKLVSLVPIMFDDDVELHQLHFLWQILIY